MVKVSVIVPAYNVEKYLAECLDSLIHQTLEDIEIIVINDGSTDCTLQILEEYAAKDRRIKIINQENTGQSVARNRGIDAAVGEYVAFVDADDWVDLDFFRKLYDAAKQENADVAAGGILFCDLNSKSRFWVKYRSRKLLHKLKEKYRYLLCNGKHCYIWNKIYHREHLLNGKLFFMAGKYYEDVFWSLQMLKTLDTVVCVPDVSYHYRFNPGSTVHTTKNDAKKMQDWKDAEAFRLQYANENKLEALFSVKLKKTVKFFGVPLIKIKSGDAGVRVYILGIRCLEIKYQRND